MKDITVGIIGFGAIGREVAEAIVDGRAGHAKLVAVLVRSPEKVEPGLAERLGCRFTADAADFLDGRLDLVVEAAGHDALRAYAEPVLRANKDLMLVAVGAFADGDFQERVSRLAHERGRRVYVVSGAIAGLDAIGAAALGVLSEVTHFIRKAPRSILPPGQAEAVQRSGQPKELFAGTAREAAPLFPENVNVAAAVSLAGAGLDRTFVRVVADPSVTRNTHEVVARGDFGELRVLLQNIPTEANPKTGRLTAMSLIKAIRNLTAPVVVGI
jgi:aspartate dehydrogenase